MTNPDYRAMCAELIERLEWFIAEDETNENDPGNQYWLTGKQAGIDSAARARALLAQPEPQPVAVRERWPGPEDCDAEGRCWTTDYEPSLAYSPVWKMTELPRQNLGHDFSNAYFWRNVRFWLPANALPTPEATVHD